MSSWIWIDGRVTPAERARVAADDAGLLRGEGIFETVSVRNRTPFLLDRHLDRLRASSKIARIDLAWTDAEITGACQAVIVEAASDPVNATVDQFRLRITVTAGPLSSAGAPSLLVMVSPDASRPDAAAVSVSPWPINEVDPLVGAKVTSRHSYTLALRDAEDRGASEAVLLNTRGMLVEGTSTNLFLVVAGRLSTPSLDTGCLPGVTRSLVMELVEVHERNDLTVDDLRFATEAFLTSTMRGVQPIASVEGTPLRSVPGPLTSAARAVLEHAREAAVSA